MGALDILIDQIRRSNVSDLAEQMEKGEVQPGQALLKYAELTGDPEAMQGAAQRQAIMGAMKDMPANGDPLTNLSTLNQRLAQSTGDPTAITNLAALPKLIEELNKSRAETDKATAEAGKARSQTHTTPSGTGISPGEEEQDKEFAKTWGTYANSGGSEQTKTAIDQINKTIGDLQSGTIQTGRLMDRNAFDEKGEPTMIGRNTSPDLINAKTNVDSAVFPLLKPLFGSRVTNFDAQSALKSYGFNPVLSPQQNIERLQTLRDRMTNAAGDLEQSGAYFTKNGTLSGYGMGGSVSNTPAAKTDAAAPQQDPAQADYIQKLLARKAQLQKGGQQ